MPLQTIHRLWRHNPLERGTDLAQAWMLLASAVLCAVLSPAAGIAAARAVNAASQPSSHGWQRVSAALTADTPARFGVDSAGAGGRVIATVRWAAPDGTVRTGEMAVAPGLRAGTRTTAWLDRNGSLLRNPVTPEDAVAQSIAVGVVTASSTGLLVLGLNKVGVLLLNRHRYAQWEKDWAETDSRGQHRQP
ncbi:Rv1733c family protein [Streptomyces lydicus]|uniref:Rv1733c family protein n=1 Tax=Streptomyces lydicus TaxID=47763 RepID=UPI0036E398B2